MTKSLKEQMAVMQAADEGKEIEVRDVDHPDCWLPLHNTRFNWAKYDYRVKPDQEEMVVSGWKFKIVPNYGVALSHCLEGSIGNMTHWHIDILHSLSLRNRGLCFTEEEKAQFIQRED